MQELGANQVAFMQGGVSINASSRDAAHEPALARALGCRVSADRRCVTLFFARSRAGDFLAAVSDSGVVAAVFSHPGSHETIQLKGVDARLVEPGPDERAAAKSQADGFVAALENVGYPSDMARQVLWHTPEDLVGVQFSICLAFDQTPGPRAGARLALSA